MFSRKEKKEQKKTHTFNKSAYINVLKPKYLVC